MPGQSRHSELIRLYRGLPATADVDPLTIDQLRADDELIREPELYLAPFQFFADAWDQGGFTSNGSWLEEGATDPDVREPSGMLS